MLKFDGKEYRNLQEQVLDNKDEIENLLEKSNITNLGINVVQAEPLPTADLLPSNYQGEFGDAYLVGTEQPYDLYVWTRGNEWFNFGPLNAPSVVPGPVGPQGIQGEQGTRGSFWYSQSGAPTVLEGVNQYDQALDGSTGNVYQFVDGWQLTGNIRGPQGIQGIQGIVGPVGPIGPQGIQGPKGEQGQFIEIIGSLMTTAQLPPPSTVPRYAAYLIPIVGTEHVFLIVGEEPNLEWHDAGGFGGGTAVTINGVQQATIDLGNDIVAPSYSLGDTTTAEVDNDGIDFLNLDINGNNPTGNNSVTQQGNIKLPIVASENIEPIVADNKVSFDLTQEFKDQLAEDIKGAKPTEVQLNVPSTSTTGQLTAEQLATLQGNKGAYIMFNNEVYRLQDTEYVPGYLIYSHIGFNNSTSVFMIKCITITLSTRVWGLNTREVVAPNDYYTKTQSDNRYYTQTQSNTNFASKAIYANDGLYFSSPGPIFRCTTGSTFVELGGSNDWAGIDFHTGASYVDYDVRLWSSGGTGTSAGGTLNVKAADFVFNDKKVSTAQFSYNSSTGILTITN